MALLDRLLKFPYIQRVPAFISQSLPQRDSHTSLRQVTDTLIKPQHPPLQASPEHISPPSRLILDDQEPQAHSTHHTPSDLTPTPTGRRCHQALPARPRNPPTSKTVPPLACIPSQRHSTTQSGLGAAQSSPPKPLKSPGAALGSQSPLSCPLRSGFNLSPKPSSQYKAQVPTAPEPSPPRCLSPP